MLALMLPTTTTHNFLIGEQQSPPLELLATLVATISILPLWQQKQRYTNEILMCFELKLKLCWHFWSFRIWHWYWFFESARFTLRVGSMQPESTHFSVHNSALLPESALLTSSRLLFSQSRLFFLYTFLFFWPSRLDWLRVGSFSIRVSSSFCTHFSSSDRVGSWTSESARVIFVPNFLRRAMIESARQLLESARVHMFRKTWNTTRLTCR